MSEFICPVDDCSKDLSRLQVMHFRAVHDCDPVEWVEEQYGDEIKTVYSNGVGCYTIAEKYEWLSSDMVYEIVDPREHNESLADENNPMRRENIVEQFTGESNPAKRPEVGEKISDALDGHPVSEETREKISRKNKNNTISEEHRQAVSDAASEIDRSYMQTEAYSRALSESLKGREPTYPSPYTVDSLSHPVRSSWEEKIAKLLVANDITYTYEDEFPLVEGSYYPDFITDGCVIEVKGWSNERSIEKATQFMSEYPEYDYIVVGAEIPCDIHIPWEDRTEVPEVIADA